MASSSIFRAWITAATNPTIHSSPSAKRHSGMRASPWPSSSDLKGWDILVVKYEGIYRSGDAGDADARYMHALGESGVRAWEAYGVILDLSGVDYRGDKSNDSLFSVGEKAFGNESLPLAVVVRSEGLGYPRRQV